MNVFFDVDDTLIAYDGSLRPRVKEVFESLKRDGHDIYIWSGVGLRWEVIKEHGLAEWVSDCFAKPLQDHQNSLASLGITMQPDYVIDDHPDVVAAFVGHHVRDYFWPDPTDREMDVIYQKIATLARLNAS